MKIYLIQPPYAKTRERGDECFRRELAMLRGVTDTDCIVLPEYSDVLWAAPDRDTVIAEHERNAPVLHEACREAAVRCGAVVFYNTLDFEDSPMGRNTTWMLDPAGTLVGKYAKRHLPPLERDTLGLDPSVTEICDPPVILTHSGVRYAFLTCYDFYFYEAFPMIARARPDVIVGCSLQRSDRHAASEIMSRHLAYNTNAYVLRCSVSMADEPGTPPDVCGASMIVSPSGDVLASLGGEIGTVTAEIDPHAKYVKAAGFGRAPAAHWEYTEYGRNPRQYRPSGPSTVPEDRRMPYPRICAHRGFNTIAPENSLPAFGAAIALGADEIEFDLRLTADGEVISLHDARLERISDGEGPAEKKTLAELQQLDFGSRFGETFRGLKVLRFEEILRKFACHTVMNVHLKTKTYTSAARRELVGKAAALIRKYDCEKYCYFMISEAETLRMAAEIAPEIPLCQGAGDEPWQIVEKAIQNGCVKVQLFKPYFDQAMIDRARAAGLKVNIFWSDDPEEARSFFAMGADTVLTNDYLSVSKVLNKRNVR